MGPELHARFSSAVDAALAGATVVTQTTRAARMLLAEALRRLRADKPACRTPDVLPLDAFYRRLWGDSLAAGAVSEALLSEPRAQALWSKVIGQSRYSNALTVHGCARMAQDAWQTAQAYGIPLDQRNFRGTAESAAFFDWASLYKEECVRGGWVDSASLAGELIRRLDRLESILPKRLVFYGVEPMTRRTSEFCAGLSRLGLHVDGISIAIDRAGAAQTLDASDTKEELRLAARWARAAMMEAPSPSIGIVVPGLRDLRAIVEAAFAEVLHPEEFLSPSPNRDRVFEIAAGKPLDEYPLVHHALLALRFTFGELPISDVSTLLRSPHIGASDEAPARAIFDVALRRNGRAQHSAEALPMTVGERWSVSLPRDFARRVRQLANLRSPQTRLLKPSEAADLFHKVLDAANWPSREPDSPEYQLREKWEDLLGDFASLDGFLPSQPAPELVDELARMTAATSFRPENSGAPVQVMDEDEAAGCAFDRLWLCRLSDEWPRVSRPNPYLPIAAQRAAGVPGLSPAEQHANAAAALARFTASANHVVFSWARQEADRELRPNRLLRDFTAADAASLCGAPLATCASLQRATAELEFRDDHNAPAADPASLPRSGTDVLKYQSQCPFRAFAQFRLGADRLESPELGLDRRKRGGLVETALEVFWRHVRDSVNLRDLTPGQRLNEILNDSVEEAFKKCWPDMPGAWNERLRGLERRRLRDLLRQWCEVELSRADFDVMLDEQQQEIAVELGPLTVHARIDRVDRVRGGGFVVIDYKSGGIRPNPIHWTSERPEEPQLPLYAIHQLDQGREVAGVAFGHVTTADPAWKGYSDPITVLGVSKSFRRNLNGNTWAQFVRGWRPTLEALAVAFVAGESAVDPKRPPGSSKTSCLYCHLSSLCRVGEVDFTAGDGDEVGGDDE